MEGAISVVIFRDAFAKARELVAEGMTAEQITEAQSRAREWTPTPEP